MTQIFFPHDGKYLHVAILIFFLNNSGTNIRKVAKSKRLSLKIVNYHDSIHSYVTMEMLFELPVAVLLLFFLHDLMIHEYLVSLMTVSLIDIATCQNLEV